MKTEGRHHENQRTPTTSNPDENPHYTHDKYERTQKLNCQPQHAITQVQITKDNTQYSESHSHKQPNLTKGRQIESISQDT